MTFTSPYAGRSEHFERSEEMLRVGGIDSAPTRSIFAPLRWSDLPALGEVKNLLKLGRLPAGPGGNRTTMSIPILETERLILRAHRREDLADYAALWADPLVVRYTTGVPQTLEESWRRLLFARGHWAVMDHGYWAVEEKGSGRFVGEVGFADLHREMRPSLEGMPEAGWIVLPAFHGSGYATEAVHAIHAWGEKRFRGARTCCIISPENDASLRVAEKTGYREVAHTLYKDHAVIVFHRDP